MNQKKISVVIRNRNEERWIGHAIQSVLENLEQPEIIVINNDSTDSSMDIVRSFRHDPALEKAEKQYTTVKTELIHDYTPGKALNMGVEISSGDIILVISAHCVLKKVDYTSLINSLEKYPCVFGKQIPVYRGKKITPRYIWSHFSDKRIVDMYSDLEERYFLHNALCFYTKEILTRIPFDEMISGKEDRIWAKNCVDLKESFLYDPTIVAEHHFTTAGNTWRGVG
jgi:rhamnosyltransferase